ncbi:HNH endonuclease (plasmid) [Paenibacillus cellulosilyticus]|uniref:HNH endonuclease n=1 Tax=Paenibacillus cellulosilyticus TaxID=375489 RepID=UPI000D717A1F|nr:HNH endonuclease signature motif containing protein [Paenibacillus cellulosilyticus]QKS48556.1 HNH endonuclease [Paenibacillus cellulosilyticus]
MPKKRPPREVWLSNIRPIIWERDQRRCVRCRTSLTLQECHIDHIQSGKLGSNALSNLRTLCRRCHVLRADVKHRGMIASALNDGIIPPNWRELVWEG